MLEIKGISKRFGDHEALQTVNLTIQDGEFFSLLGPSGCGKTTLLRLMGGFDNPSTGSIHLDGKRVDYTNIRDRRINMVFQKYALFPHLNVWENVAFGLRAKKVAEAEIKTRVEETLRLVKMQAYGQRGVETLSGGQQQRIALARALVNRPKVLLLDEPLSALDQKLRQQMQIELVTLQRRLNITFIFVTHDQEEALRLSDRIAVINGGQIEQVGTPQEIYEYPRTAFVADFIGTINPLNGIVHAASPSEVCLRLGSGEQICAQPTRDGKRPLPNVRVGDHAVLMVRPENLCLQREPTPGQKNVVPAVIKEVLYKGAVTEILMEPTLPQLPNLLVSEPNGSPTLEDLPLDIGAKYFVSWAADDAFIMANGTPHANL